MWKSRSLVTCLLLLFLASLAAAQGSNSSTKAWQTLDGTAPLVIARGGFSGIFPDSSAAAYQLAGLLSLSNVIFYCDVQLTKDAAGICASQLRLDNGTTIANVFPNKKNAYSVNGVLLQGWFSVDFTLKDLEKINLVQGVYSRPNRFDANLYPVLTVQDVIAQLSPPGLWLNIQHDAFFSQQNLSMRSFVISVFRSAVVNYVSSPEVTFLRSLVARLPSKTKLIFRFLGQDEVEPSTNQTYGSLLSNLTFIKTFASGILVPKDYIWPVGADLYLQAHTTVVLDAHKAGLEVFASGFANDNSFPYDFSYDPLAESLSFIDNGNFSVDGMLSDFPITQSEAIDCFAHIAKNVSGQASPLVIAPKGSSGDFPSCTDLAYQRAISDGVDVLGCPVQMSKDGTLFCLDSINLIESTLAAQSVFSNLTTTIPELGLSGIFAFSLTWSQIQTLTPQIENPYISYRLVRNPKSKNAGKFLTLAEFLGLANNASSLSGVLVSIEDAAYLAEYQGLGVTDALLDTLRNFSHITPKVMIQSTNSSVLIKFKKESSYELIYAVDENIRGADNSSIEEIATFANAVVVSKHSVIAANSAYMTNMTNVVQKLQAFKLAVYVQLFNNEFVSQYWDCFSDATVELNAFYEGAGIDGVITEYPGTAAKYKKNQCLGLGNNSPPYMTPVQPGGLYQLIAPVQLPPAEAPNPLLTDSDVVEPALPPVTAQAPPPRNQTTVPSLPPSSGQPRVVSSVFPSLLAFLIATLALF